jgi:hypothetical protein
MSWIQDEIRAGRTLDNNGYAPPMLSWHRNTCLWRNWGRDNLQNAWTQFHLKSFAVGLNEVEQAALNMSIYAQLALLEDPNFYSSTRIEDEEQEQHLQELQTPEASAKGV